MTDNIINPDQRTLIAYNDYMITLPHIEVEASGDYVVKGTDIGDDKPNFDVRFNSAAQRSQAAYIRTNPPKTVGELWRRYLTTASAYASNHSSYEALERALERINREMNEYAEDNNFCIEYETTLGQFNKILVDEGYKGYFTFTGRKTEKEVTVRRYRTVLEEVTFTMELGHDEEPEWADAVDIATDCDDWNVIDEEYDTTDYEITNVE